MSTLARKIYCKNALMYASEAIFFALFGLIYEQFSHEVYSYFMLYAFMIPLVLGALPQLVCSVIVTKLPEQTSLTLWHCGILTLSIGCILEGVLEIYGTTNHLIYVYPVAGILLLCIATILSKALKK